MMQSVAALLFVGLAAVSAQFSSTPAPFFPSSTPFYGAYQQPYPYQQYNAYPYSQQYPGQYPGGYYNQYRAPAPPAPSTVVVKKIYGTPQKPNFVPAPVYASPAPVYASPAPVYAQVKSGVQDKDANIVAESREVNYDGTFSYGFDTDNGISVKSKGYLKNPQAQNEDAIQVIEGSYSYYDRDGKPVSISYIADEAGYRAFGDAIPTPPEEYVRAIANAPPPSPERK